MFQRPDRIAAPLHVVTPVFNSPRYRSRWALYEKFAKRVVDAGAVLWTVELAFGERAFAVTSFRDPQHIQLRVHDHQEIWLKENAINAAIARLPADWRYVAWVDADTHFTRPDWVGETLHKLQHYSVVQMFSEAQDLDHDYRPLQRYRSFGWCYQHEADVPPLRGAARFGSYVLAGKLSGLGYWHPGFAWAARREAIETLGGLIDWSILGGGDTFMAWALIGRLNDRTMPRSLGPSGVRWLQRWQERAEHHIRRNIGCVDGLLLHHWHGGRGRRAYKDRGQILTAAHFDPERDLKRDSQGLWQLEHHAWELRDGIRAYFAARNEDQLSEAQP